MSAISSLLMAASVSLFQTDAAIIGTALAAQQSKIHVGGALVGCILGSAVGDVAWFLCGRHLGKWAMTRRPFSWFVRPHQVQWASHWLTRRGDFVLLGSRFLPALCTAIQFAAGMLHTRPRRAIPLLLVAAVANTLVVFSLASWLGHEMETYLTAYRDWAVWIVAAAGAALLLVLHFGPGLLARPAAASPLADAASPSSESSPGQL